MYFLVTLIHIVFTCDLKNLVHVVGKGERRNRKHTWFLVFPEKLNIFFLQRVPFRLYFRAYHRVVDIRSDGIIDKFRCRPPFLIRTSSTPVATYFTYTTWSQEWCTPKAEIFNYLTTTLTFLYLYVLSTVSELFGVDLKQKIFRRAYTERYLLFLIYRKYL